MIEKHKCWICGKEYYLFDHFSVTCIDCDKKYSDNQKDMIIYSDIYEETKFEEVAEE